MSVFNMTFYCEDCDKEIDFDDIFIEFSSITNDVEIAHEGPEVSIGGDGYGGRCAGTMDCPTLHIVEARLHEDL